MNLDKFYKKNSLLVVVLASFITMIEANQTTLLYTSDWHMIEDIFVTQPLEEATSWAHRLARTTAACGTLWGSYALMTKFFKKNDNNGDDSDDEEEKDTLVETGKISFSTLAGIVSYISLYNVTLNYKELAALKQFVADWPSYKPAAPTQIKPLFDQLHQEHLAEKPLNTRSANHTIRLLKQAVYNNFPEKYGKKASKNSLDIHKFFDYKKFEAEAKIEAGNFLRGIADLYRAITGR